MRPFRPRRPRNRPWQAGVETGRGWRGGVRAWDPTGLGRRGRGRGRGDTCARVRWSWRGREAPSATTAVLIAPALPPPRAARELCWGTADASTKQWPWSEVVRVPPSPLPRPRARPPKRRPSALCEVGEELAQWPAPPPSRMQPASFNEVESSRLKAGWGRASYATPPAGGVASASRGDQEGGGPGGGGGAGHSRGPGRVVTPRVDAARV